MHISSTLRSTIALFGFAAIGACAVRTPRGPTGYASTASIDTVAARLVDLELQRISLLATSPTDSLSTRRLDTQIAVLRERVRVSTSRGSANRIVAERVILALDVRESAVVTRLRELRLVYTDQYPTVRQAIEEERLLRERKAELHKAGH